MSKTAIIQIAIFAAVIGFVLLNTFLAAIKPIQPKIIVTTPKVVIQQPAPKVITKTIVVKQKEKTASKSVAKQSGLLHKIKHMLGG